MEWKAVTTGGFTSCDIWVDEIALTGSLKINTNFAQAHGGLDKAILKKYRLKGEFTSFLVEKK